MPSIGRIGICSAELRHGDADAVADAAGELDALGFDALWISGETSGDLLDYSELLLRATSRTTIATGILNIWMHDARDVAAWWHALPALLMLQGLGLLAAWGLLPLMLWRL